MHRCFYIPEILYLICDELYDTSFRHHNDLCALARTCRAFHDPALVHLWNRLHSIAPLIKCMPSDLWRVEVKEGKEKLSFKRPIISSDWTRLLTYARHVRMLILFYDDLKNTSDYLALSLAAGSQVLLPNLRQLLLGCISSDDIVFSCMIHLFLGPEVKKFSIFLNGSSVVRHSLLANLSIQHPSLTDVSLQGSSHHLRSISAVVKNWNQLQSLTIPNLTHDALIHVATLPDLRDLHLTDLNENPISRPVGGQCSPLFPSLHTLGIATQNIEFCVSFVEITTFILGVINIYSQNPTPPFVWARLYHALQTHCDNSSLTSLYLGYNAAYLDQENDPRLIEAHQVMPLLSFSNLSDINLAPGGGIDLNNSLVKKMAKAWQYIEVLIIDDRSLGRPTSKVTLSGLVPFAKFCPKLVHLGIFFNGTFDRLTTKRPSRSIYNESLIYLNVFKSPIGLESDIYSLASTALFLLRIFPNLDTIYNKTSNEAWRIVEEFVRVFSAGTSSSNSTNNSDDDDNLVSTG